MIMTVNQELNPVNESHYLRGFSNLFRKEIKAWWNTRRWWINALIWTGVLGGLVVMMAFILPSVAEATGDPNVAAAGGPLAFGLEMGRTVFFELGSLVIAIGVIVVSQDLIIDEKQNGLTEWLLAKPVARRSYLLSKLASSIISILILLVAFPALAAYLLLTIRSNSLFPINLFLCGLGIVSIHTLFYLTITLMLGVFFNSRPPVLGIVLGILLSGNLLSGFLQPLLYITPWSLAKVASLTAGGESIPLEMLVGPLVASVLWSIAFVLIGITKFEKTEF
jgi:ABC-type transport system involved in multi-copper enzyme maturation permease subunit